MSQVEFSRKQSPDFTPWTCPNHFGDLFWKRSAPELGAQSIRKKTIDDRICIPRNTCPEFGEAAEFREGQRRIAGECAPGRMRKHQPVQISVHAVNHAPRPPP